MEGTRGSLPSPGFTPGWHLGAGGSQGRLLEEPCLDLAPLAMGLLGLGVGFSWGAAAPWFHRVAEKALKKEK